MATKTLLDRAKLRKDYRKPRTQVNEKQLEDLAIAYLTSEIGFMGAEEALKKTGNTVYGTLASSLRRAFAKGRITIKQ